MSNVKQNQAGVTLMELLVYLGISSLVVVGMSVFMLRTVEARSQINDQRVAQHTARQIIERITTTVRNARDVVTDVPNAPSWGVNIISLDYTDPSNPVTVISRYMYDPATNQLKFGQATNNAPTNESLQVIHETDTKVKDVMFEKVSAGLEVHITGVKNGQAAAIDTTIAVRQ